MKVISIKSIGNPKILQIQNIAKPHIRNGFDVLVCIKAAGVNPIDSKLRSGIYPLTKFPAILGCDGSGIVEEIGAKVTKVKKGDAVYFFHGGLDGIQGNYAEYKVLNQRFLAHKPESLTFVEAAAAPLVLITAWEALFDHAQLTKNKTIFINAGAGGVGHIAIQLAKYKESIVYTSISNKHKADFVKKLGADYILNYKKQNVMKEILNLTNNQGVDIALDNIGGKEIQNIFLAITHYGQITTLLQPDETIDWSMARFKNINLNFEVMLSPLIYNLKNKQIHQTKILDKCAKLFDSGRLKIHINHIIPLEEAAHAHAIIEEGHTMGKIVLEIK